MVIAVVLGGCLEGLMEDPTPEQDPTPPERVGRFRRINLTEVASGFKEPIGIVAAPDGTGRLFVLEKAGFVRVIHPDGSVQEEAYLDLHAQVASAGSEQGLLGMAFHPDFAENGRLFVSYIDKDHNAVVAELRASEDGQGTDPGFRRQIFAINKSDDNHNGSTLLFGPDGFLYISLGDGGGAYDEFKTGQDRDSLLASILRIDPDSIPFSIPPDNPFVDGEGADEKWAMGLRNPYRMSFDAVTGHLWIGDVGQRAWEEINLHAADDPAGTNYGWPIMEGPECVEEPCSSQGLTGPIAAYTHADGCAVVGGHVYRGLAQPAMYGYYLYADYCSGKVWALDAEDPAKGPMLIADTDLLISTFGQDSQGELYLADMAGGAIYRITARPTQT